MNKIPKRFFLGSVADYGESAVAVFIAYQSKSVNDTGNVIYFFKMPGYDESWLERRSFAKIELLEIRYIGHYQCFYLQAVFKGFLKEAGRHDIAFLIEPSIGPVLANRRCDDYWGDIKGQGGLILQMQGAAVWNALENIRVEAGAFYGLQWLEGGGTDSPVPEQGGLTTSGVVRFDNHAMEAFGATIGVDFLF